MEDLGPADAGVELGDGLFEFALTAMSGLPEGLLVSVFAAEAREGEADRCGGGFKLEAFDFAADDEEHVAGIAGGFAEDEASGDLFAAFEGEPPIEAAKGLATKVGMGEGTFEERAGAGDEGAGGYGGGGKFEFFGDTGFFALGDDAGGIAAVREVPGAFAIGAELGLHGGEGDGGDLSDAFEAEEAKALVHEGFDGEDFDGDVGEEFGFAAGGDHEGIHDSRFTIHDSSGGGCARPIFKRRSGDLESKIQNGAGGVGSEEAIGGADAGGEAGFTGDRFVEFGEVGGFGETEEFGESADFEVDVAGVDDFDEGAAHADDASKALGFGAGEAFLDGEEDGGRAEGKCAAEGGADGNAGFGGFGGAGGDAGVFFGCAADNDGAVGEFGVFAPGESDEEVGDLEAGDVHGIWEYRTLVLEVVAGGFGFPPPGPLSRDGRGGGSSMR